MINTAGTSIRHGRPKLRIVLASLSHLLLQSALSFFFLQVSSLTLSESTIHLKPLYSHTTCTYLHILVTRTLQNGFRQ
jgi:hypothetical protein